MSKKSEDIFNNWFMRTYQRKPLCHALLDDIKIRDEFFAGMVERDKPKRRAGSKKQTSVMQNA